MGDLIRAPLSEINATLELLDRQGVTQHDFKVLRNAAAWNRSIVGRVHKTDRFLWAMLMMEEAAKSVGFTEDDFLGLARDKEKMRQVLLCVRGFSGNTINCDAPPFTPDGWTIAPESEQLPNRVRGQLIFDPTKIKLYLSPNQQDGKRIEGNNLRKELENELTLNATVLDYLLAHPELIPEEWERDEKGVIRYIFFWGTVYRNLNGSLCVRYLYFFCGRWNWDYELLYFLLDGYSPSAVRASS